MSKQEATAKFLALGHERQIAVLADFGHRITIAARGTYVPGTDQVADSSGLRRANEVLHRVLGQIRAMADGDAKRYPEFVPSVGAMLNLIAWHPFMHAGQWVAVRRQLKKPVVI